VNGQSSICTAGINEVCYKLFHHTLCGISTSIGHTSCTVLNHNKNNFLNMFAKMGESGRSPHLEKGVMLRVSKSKRKDRQEKGQWKADCSENYIM
jgi:hypothetical protein